ncbi:MAG: acetylserotonin O-methyltransferase [Acidobacteriota bacterium]|nr:acetylserotonin O-methyltransferase [Acidobacteriota bacterium]
MSTETKAAPERTDQPSADQILIQLFTGMWAMQAVAAASRLRIADQLATGPKTPEEVAAASGTNPGATRRLMRAVASLGLFVPAAGGRYGLTEPGERLRSDHPATFRDAFIAETDNVHWQSWAKLDDAIRTGDPRPQAVFGLPAFDYYGKNREEGEQFGRAMENISRFAAFAVLEAYDFSDARTVLDVGGGNGSMVLAVLDRCRNARGIVCDLPYIEQHANERIRAADAADRVRFQPGDFFESVPAGADVHLMKFILHDWNDAEAIRILKRSREALAPGGRLIVIEMIVPEGNRLEMVHLMDLNMLVMTGGLERTESEFRSLFERSGYQLTAVRPTASPFSVIEARPVGSA